MAHMAHWSEEVKNWTMLNQGNVSPLRVEQSIKTLLKRQRGRLITIQKVAKHVRKELKIVARHSDLDAIMLDMKAMTVEGTARNRYIYDITKCVLMETDDNE